jgi:Rrf2 family protein
MKITAQEEYGLRCLLRLARAVETGRPLAAREIAAAEGLSLAYVHKLLRILRQGGIIKGVPGPAGGTRLAEPASELTLGAVLLVLGEPLFDEPAYCQQHAGSEANGLCVHHGACTLRGLWHTLEQWMRQALDRLTLADLLHNEGQITELLRDRLADAVLQPVNSLIQLSVVGKE